MAPTPHKKISSGLYRPLAEINVTPLVDVMLVLLVIFMVTAPLLSTGLKVNLPQAKQATPLNPKESIILTIAKDGSLSLGSDEIPKDQLIDAIHGRLAGDDAEIIHLRGDKEVPFGDVVSIMDLLAANGLTHVAIVTQMNGRANPSTPTNSQAQNNSATPANAPTPDKSAAPTPTPAAPLSNDASASHPPSHSGAAPAAAATSAQ